MKSYKKILVTGGAGFIGSHLVDELIKDDYDVIVLDNLSTGKKSNVSSKARLIVDDINNASMVDELMQDVDACFHLAAIASVTLCEEQWLSSHQTNLIGSLNILEAAKSGKKPVIYASSAAVYGDNPRLPIIETDYASPISRYGADKLSMEYHAKVMSHLHLVPTTGFRFFNVYGPRQDPASPYSGVISIFMNRVQQQEPITIFGDGEQSRDFVYVQDVVQFLKRGLETVSTEAKTYNVCTGQSTTIKSIAQTIMKVADREVAMVFADPKPGDIRYSLGSASKAQNELGITAKTTLSAGLTALFNSLN